MMKILMVASNYPPLLGGPASSVPYLCKELAEKGIEVHVVTQGASGYPNVAKENGFTVHRAIEVAGKYYLPHIILRKVFSMSKLTEKVIRDCKIDVMHSHDLNVSGMVGSLANRHKIPSLCRFGGDLAWEYLSLFNWTEENPEKLLRSNGLSVRFLEYVQKKISEGYDIIAAISEYQKDWLIKFTKLDESRISVLRNGVPSYPKDKAKIKKFREHFGGGFILSAASRFVPWKGLQYLIPALKLLPEDVKLIIAGSGPYEQSLRNLTNSLSLDDRVVFFGKVKYDDIREFVSASDAFILPSLYEPFSIGLLDTLMTDTPIVATAVGGTVEVIKHKENGLLVKPRDPEDLAEKILMIKDGPQLRKKLVGNQHKSSKEYSWKRRVKDFIKTYESLI